MLLSGWQVIQSSIQKNSDTKIPRVSHYKTFGGILPKLEMFRKSNSDSKSCFTTLWSVPKIYGVIIFKLTKWDFCICVMTWMAPHCPASRMEREGNARWHWWSVQTSEDVSRSLAAVKTTLCGSGGEDASAEVSAQLSQEMCSGHLLQQLIENLGRIDFEASILLFIYDTWCEPVRIWKTQIDCFVKMPRRNGEF